MRNHMVIPFKFRIFALEIKNAFAQLLGHAC